VASCSLELKKHLYDLGLGFWVHGIMIGYACVIGKSTELAKLNIGPQPQLTVLVVIPINAFFERYHVSVCR